MLRLPIKHRVSTDGHCDSELLSTMVLVLKTLEDLSTLADEEDPLITCFMMKKWRKCVQLVYETLFIG